MDSPLTIAIIGAGNVGGALGRSLVRTGHRVVFGVRDPLAAKTAALLADCGPLASADSVVNAVRQGTVVILATPWPATEEILRTAGDFTGKVLIDCTNPLKVTPGVGLELALGFSDSGGECVARWSGCNRVVKAFNTYGWENFADARYPNAAGLLPLMFLAGDDESAKATVAGLAQAIGFEPFDAGSLRRARELEPLAMLWIRAALAGNRSPHFTWARLSR